MLDDYESTSLGGNKAQVRTFILSWSKYIAFCSYPCVNKIFIKDIHLKISTNKIKMEMYQSLLKTSSHTNKCNNYFPNRK